MRKALAVLAATVALTACGGDGGDGGESAAPSSSAASSSTSAPATSPAPSSPAPSATGFPADQLPRAEVERIFAANMEESGFIPRYGSAEEVLELADLVCVHFNRGGSMPELLDLVAPEMTMSESDFRGFAAAAAVGFCPEHVGKVVNQ